MSHWQPSRYVEYGTKEDTYEWTQTPDEVSITIHVSSGLTAKQLTVDIKANSLLVKEKESGKVYIEGELTHSIDVDDSAWTKDGETVELTLTKGIESQGDEEGHWWASVIKGAKEIDVKRIEGARYLDDSILKQIWEKEQQEKKEKEEKK